MLQDQSLPTSASLLRFLTCGSVDDGKSTLIGRLLYDAGLVADDQLAAVHAMSARRGFNEDLPDLSLLLDGLLDERAQGITIDVAWRYFQTSNRKFILGDTPGHEQYTRNMVSGASQCQLALILVDARKGVLAQTRRHAAVVSLLGIEKIVVVVNKMDLVQWDELAYINIQRDFLEFSGPLGIHDPVFIPVSALRGDNVVSSSKHMAWYTGSSLFDYLETVDVESKEKDASSRFPVQRVTREREFRGYAGTLTAGRMAVGDQVIALPTGTQSRVASIVTFDASLDSAETGQAITLTLADNIDITRGDVLVARSDDSAIVTDRLEADLVWMDEQPLLPGRRYEMRIGTTTVPATVKRLLHRLNLETMNQEPATRLVKNDIGKCEIMTERPVQADLYASHPRTGSLILIDRISNGTAGAGMVRVNRARQVFWEDIAVDKAARSETKAQKPRVVWFTGLSGAGKSTLANAVEKVLHQEGFHTYLIDGDNVRHGLCKDLGFSLEDRIENTRRVGELSKLMIDAGLIVLVSLISPFRNERRMVREMLAPGEFVEVYVSTPIQICEERDRKGLYKLAREGKLENFTGISSPYEPPESAELTIDTASESLEESVQRVVKAIRKE